MKIISSQLHKNMLSGAILTVINIVVGLAMYPVYISYLGMEIYGFWLILALVITLSRLGMLGIPTTMIKIVAEAEKQKDTILLKEYISSALTLVIGAGIIITILIFLIRSPIVHMLALPIEMEGMAYFYIPIVTLLSCYIFIVETTNSFLSGLGRMDQANYIQSSGRLITLISSFILLFSGFGIASMVVGNAAGYFYVHVASVIYIKKIQPITLFPSMHLDKIIVVRILKFGGGLSGMALLNLLLSPFNKIILSRYVGLDSIVVYEIGTRIANQLRAFFHISFKALLPEISKKEGSLSSNNFSQIVSLNIRYLKFIFLVGMPLYFVIFWYATPVLKIWLGDDFVVTMSTVLQILLLSSFITLIGTPSYFTMLALGKVKTGLLSMLIQSSFNVIGVIFILTLNIPITIEMIAWIVALSMVVGQIFLLYQNFYFVILRSRLNE
jgi:O-antigen/teichoic acid export membrane protein